MVIGHDFASTGLNDQQAKLLENSVFYNPVTSVEVLSFEHYANPAVVANGKSILNQFATQHSIALVLDPVNDDTLIAAGVSIADVSVILVWDQPNAPAGKLATLGAQWAPSLAAFTKKGGIVIALDAADGVAEMGKFETAAALLDVTSHGPVAPGTIAAVPAAGLSIAVGMTDVYSVGSKTAAFATSDTFNLKLIEVADLADGGVVDGGSIIAVHKLITN